MCMNTQTGDIIHLPQSGGIIDNSQAIIDNMRYSWRTWRVWNTPNDNKTSSDYEFMKWVTGE